MAIANIPCIKSNHYVYQPSLASQNTMKMNIDLTLHPTFVFTLFQSKYEKIFCLKIIGDDDDMIFLHPRSATESIVESKF